jgi:hypothetical protein
VPDAPDDYQGQPGSLVDVIANVGELPPRLGIASGLNRTGNVIWYDDMSHGITPYNLTSLIIGSEFAPTAKYSYISGYGIRLAGKPAGGGSIGIERDIGGAYEDNKGLEIPILSNQGTGSLTFTIKFFRGLKQTIASIKLDLTNGDVYYLNSANVFVLFHNISGSVIVLGAWVNVKLIVDFINDVYNMLIIDGNRIPMTQHARVLAIATTYDELITSVVLTGAVATQSEVIIGAYTITYGEP